MDISVFSPGQLPTVFRALRTALTEAPTLAPQEKELLETFAAITDYKRSVTSLEVIRASDVEIEGEHQRKRLVQLAALSAMLSRPVRASSAKFVAELGAHLGVAEPVIAVLDALSRGKRMKARLLTARRGLGALLREARQAEGIMGIVRFAYAILFQGTVNKDKHLRYKRLGLLPEGTLGREYWKHLTELGYGFPGEPGGIPDTAAYHDIAHVLAENDTTPMGEMQQGSFQAGNRREDGFFFAQFVMLQFHHGIQLTPVAAPETGYFEPGKVLWAIHRGAMCNVDMTHQWNYWPLMSLPLEEARELCGVTPKVA